MSGAFSALLNQPDKRLSTSDGVFAGATVVEVLGRYAEQRLGLVWRQWLTRRFLDRYLAGRAYLRLVQRHA